MDQKKSSANYIQIIIGLALLGTTIWLIIDSQNNIKKCSEYVPVQNCNKPAGDFAVEIDTTSTNILTWYLTIFTGIILQYHDIGVF